MRKRKHEKRWDEWSSDRFRWFASMKIDQQVIPRVQIFSKFFEEDFKMLDICCGAGRYYGVIVNKLKLIQSSNYIGIDNNRGMLLEAQKRYKDGNFYIGDAYNLEFKDHFFDVCLLMDVIQHVPDYKPLVKEMFRVSKKYIIITTWWTEGIEKNQYEKSDKISKPINKSKFLKFLESLKPKEISFLKDEIIIAIM